MRLVVTDEFSNTFVTDIEVAPIEYACETGQVTAHAVGVRECTRSHARLTGTTTFFNVSWFTARFCKKGICTCAYRQSDGANDNNML
eukprot:m.1209084 g.1209084  ORF g.1209084 m.1209084 type:complete len:87 (+) comp24590_c2_seq16:2-262(+)